MKNYGDLGGCYPPTDNTLLDLYNSSYDTQLYSLAVKYADLLQLFKSV